MSFLITFKSTTAAIRAQRLGKGVLKPIPFSLSRTCYGMGLFLEQEKDLKDTIQAMKENAIDYKKVWVFDKEDYFQYRGDSE